MSVKPLYPNLLKELGCGSPVGDEQLAAKVQALAEKNAENEKKIAELTAFKDKLIAALTDVQTFNGEVSFKAFAKDFQF